MASVTATVLARRFASPSLGKPLVARLERGYATVSSNKRHHKVVIVGAGTAGVTVAAQLQRSNLAREWLTSKDDIAIIDPAQTHHYQVCQDCHSAYKVRQADK